MKIVNEFRNRLMQCDKSKDELTHTQLLWGVAMNFYFIYVLVVWNQFCHIIYINKTMVITLTVE